MKFEILRQEKNPLLHREEYVIGIESDANPSFEDVKNFLDKDEGLVVVKRIENSFGSRNFKSEVFIYEEQKYKEGVEVVPKKVRKKLEEEAKKRAEEEAKKNETVEVEEGKDGD